MYDDIKCLEGKTIKSIEFPDIMEMEDFTMSDCNIQITFTDGSILNLASWDYEGYSSGIYKEIIKPSRGTS